MDSRVKCLETSTPKAPSGALAPATPKPTPAAAKPVKDEEEEEDDVDLFGSDSEEEESEDAKRVKEARLAAYHAKKSKKPVLIAKSNIILDVKPWDDETDMKALEAEVRKIEIDGLLWGASKLVPLAYGIHKLQISCVVEDDKVSIDLLQENIESIEDFVSIYFYFIHQFRIFLFVSEVLKISIFNKALFSVFVLIPSHRNRAY